MAVRRVGWGHPGILQGSANLTWLFVISGNPLEPGAESRPDNQGKQEDGGKDERTAVHLHHHGDSLLTPPLGRPFLTFTFCFPPNDCLAVNVRFWDKTQNQFRIWHTASKSQECHTPFFPLWFVATAYPPRGPHPSCERKRFMMQPRLTKAWLQKLAMRRLVSSCRARLPGQRKLTSQIRQ